MRPTEEVERKESGYERRKTGTKEYETENHFVFSAKLTVYEGQSNLRVRGSSYIL